MIKAAFDGRPSKGNNAVVALSSFQNDIRMMVQHAEFTLHGITTPLEKLPGHKKFLIKFVIPAVKKPYLKNLLVRFGISEASNYPDLEHLANEVKTMTFVN